MRPLLDNLEVYFEKVAEKPIETIFEVEDELTERLIADAEAAIGEALGAVLVDGATGPLSDAPVHTGRTP